MENVLNLTEASIAMEIFMHLLEKGSLSADKNRELYDEFVKEKIMALVKMYAEKANCEARLINNTVYLIPCEDNKFLGYTKAELKSDMLKSNATEQDYYLANFIILTLITSFYNASAGLLKSRFQIKYSEFENLIGSRLMQADDYRDIEVLEDETQIAYNSIIDKWNSLKATETKGQSKTTKTGFVLSVIKFLSNQGLVSYYEKDEIIKTTTKMDDLVNAIVLNKSNFKKIEESFRNLGLDNLEEKADEKSITE